MSDSANVTSAPASWVAAATTSAARKTDASQICGEPGRVRITCTLLLRRCVEVTNSPRPAERAPAERGELLRDLLQQIEPVAGGPAEQEREHADGPEADDDEAD